MIRYHKSETPRAVAELVNGTATVSTAGDILDIMCEVGYKGCSRLIVHSADLSPDFFNLRTGLAGEILQKLSNYRMQLVIVGDFSNLKSKSLRDFIRESNRGKSVNFLSSADEAISALLK